MSTPADDTALARTRIRVRYPETDRMGVAYHANYLVWFEIGRTEWLRERGAHYGRLEEQDDVFLPVVELGVRYRSPAAYDDELELETRLEQVGGSRVRFSYRLLSAADGRELATGFTVHATVDGSTRLRRLPAELRQRLLSALGTARG